jgi:hypothetical protein
MAQNLGVGGAAIRGLAHGHHLELPHLEPYKVVCKKKRMTLLGR